jgi:hypothetical protein
MRDEERAVQLRELVRRLQAAPPSFNRDKLLDLTRRRLVEIEGQQDFDPPTTHPALPSTIDLPPPRTGHPPRK